MTDFAEILQVEIIPSDETAYTFAATLIGPFGRRRVAVPVEAILNYSTAQRFFLATIGAIVRHQLCEGMPGEQADRIWRSYMDSMLILAWRAIASSASAQAN